MFHFLISLPDFSTILRQWDKRLKTVLCLLFLGTGRGGCNILEFFFRPLEVDLPQFTEKTVVIALAEF
jgi:hypothetical protein